MDYEVVIIGGGPAGLSCALYCARYNLKTVLIAGEFGGQLNLTTNIQNYLGIEQISGYELTQRFVDHAKKQGANLVLNKVMKIKKTKEGFIVLTPENNYKTKTIVLATGASRKKLNIKCSDKFEGKGISYCATCDGPLYKNKTVAVVGGSDAAATSAIYLSAIAKKVYLIYRKEKLRCESALENKILETKNIELIMNMNITEFLGSKVLEKIRLDNNKELNIDGVFVEIGSIPSIDLTKDLGIKTDKNDLIEVNDKAETNINGVFAAGDVTSRAGEFKQIITSAAEGAIASRSILDYLQKKGNYRY
jgi:thioredoxin reductase (NADPH)